MAHVLCSTESPQSVKWIDLTRSRGQCGLQNIFERNNLFARDSKSSGTQKQTLVSQTIH